MRGRGFAVSCLVLMTGVMLVVVAPAAHAICLGPSLDTTPSRGSAGSPLTVTGRAWATCQDVIVCHIVTPTPSPEPSGSPTQTPTPTSSCEPVPPSEPYENILVTFEQNGHEWELGTVDAHGNGAFELTAEVPAAADPGPADILACYPASGCGVIAKTGFRVLGLAGTGEGRILPLGAAGLAMIFAGLAVLAMRPRSRFLGRPSSPE